MSLTAIFAPRVVETPSFRSIAPTMPSAGAVKRPDAMVNSRNLAWLLLQEDADLSDEERAVMAGLERGCPAIIQARELALRFARGLRDRQPKMLVPWVLEAQSSSIAALKEFAVGLEREISAIKAAFCLEWSNGPVEGVVNKIKFVKRQMFGRASFEFVTTTSVTGGVTNPCIKLQTEPK
ncbi:MAG: transposase [Pleurocapsa sp. SU_196_0]|nr:transposase [Pleurocapsa sp. SU_196_0]